MITSTGPSRKPVQPERATEENKSDKVWLVPVSKIIPNADQPRRNFKSQELAELADSIKKHGILQPLLVSEKADGNFELVAGERRLRAAKLASLATVPVLVKNMADQEKLEVALIENIQREDLNPIEEAFAYKRLMDEFNLTQQDVAAKVGKSRPAVANTVRLLDLPTPAQEALIEGKINSGQARALLSLENETTRLEMLASMLGQKITVREAEREAGKRRIQKGFLRRDPNLEFLEDKLRLALGTRANITQKGEKGTIVINYYSKEELNRLLDRLTG